MENPFTFLTAFMLAKHAVGPKNGAVGGAATAAVEDCHLVLD